MESGNRQAEITSPDDEESPSLQSIPMDNFVQDRQGKVYGFVSEPTTKAAMLDCDEHVYDNDNNHDVADANPKAEEIVVDPLGVDEGNTQPGAVAIQGITHSSECSTSSSPCNDDIYDTPSHPEAIQAYPVDQESHEDSQLVVTATLDHRCRNFGVGVLLTLLLTAFTAVISIVITSPLEANSDGPKDPQLGKLLISFVYTGNVRGTDFMEGRQWRRVQNGNKILTTQGNAITSWCEVIPCHDNDGACKYDGKPYYEGCCLGEDCPEQDKCSEQCPKDACVPGFQGCISPECFNCQQQDGRDIFRMRAMDQEVICIDYGTAETLEGQPYTWVVFCSRIVSGGVEERNYGNGEYSCMAFRKGKGILPQDEVTDFFPCQFIQLGECGCAPDSINPYGLDHPTKSCADHGDCPFLCSDVPESDPQKLCEAFGIEWWEGKNFMNQYMFVDQTKYFDVEGNPETNLLINIYD